MLLFKENNFRKEFIRICLIAFIAYFFMFCHTIWGNHDWEFLKKGVELKDGFFEARYSQHLFSVLLFDGEILPFFCLGIALLNLILTGITAAKYFGVAHKPYALTVMSLFVVLNPFVFVSLYYMYLSIPLTFWHLLTVGLLFLAEMKITWKTIVIGGIGYGILLGGYPPLVALSLTLFCAKRVIEIRFHDESFKDGRNKTISLCGQWGIGYLLFKCIVSILVQYKFVWVGFYNLKMRSPMMMVKQLPYEICEGFLQLFHDYIFIGGGYAVLLGIGAIGAMIYCLCGKRHFLLIFWMVALLGASRVLYILSDSTFIAGIRLEYWGRLGLALFALSVWWKNENVWSKNLCFLWSGLLLAVCLCVNLEMQKVHWFGFKANRAHQTRLMEILNSQDKFDVRKQYMGYSFGKPEFNMKYIKDAYTKECGSEICGELSFEWDMAGNLFWEEKKNPVIMSKVTSGNYLLLINKNNYQGTEFFDNPENMSNIRTWLYTVAHPYPHKDFVYVDDKYIIMIFNEKGFYRNRELVIGNLDK